MLKYVREVSVGVTLAILGATAVQAAPIHVAPATMISLDTSAMSGQTEQVAYRGRYYARRHYVGRRYYNPAGAAVAGAALGLIGAGVAAATAPAWHHGYYGRGYGYYGPGPGYGDYDW